MRAEDGEKTLDRPRFMCLVAAPRTGSTQLGRVLRSFETIANYGETFHPHAAYSLRPLLPEIGRRGGVVLPDDVNDQAAIDFVRANPTLVIDVMGAAARPEQCVAFKVFSFHLRTPEVRTEVLGRADLLPVFLRRRVIDSYVSNRKAARTKTWRQQDTTNMQVTAKIDDFESWAARELRWYRETAEIASSRGLPVHVMTYETDIEPGEQRTAERIVSILGTHGIDIDLTKSGDVDSMTKQDRTSEVSEKVRNWSAFERELHGRGLHDLAFGYFI